MFWQTWFQWLAKKRTKTVPRVALAFSTTGVSLAFVDEKKIQGCVYIQNDEQMGETLKQVVERKGLLQAPCVCILKPSDYQTFLFEKPDLPEQELLSALRWRLADLIDFPLTSAQLDYIDVPRRHEEGASMIYLVVANQAKIQHCFEWAEQAGLQPIRVVIPELALSSLFVNMASSEKTKVLVSLQNTHVHIVIYKADQVLMMRRFNVNDVQASTTSEAFAEHLALEIQRSLDYCSAHMMDTSNALIYLSSNDDAIGLDSKLEAITGVPVYPFKVDHLVGMHRGITPNMINYAAIGAAMDGMMS